MTSQALIHVGPEQSAISFPASLTERYAPRRIADFIGVTHPKRVLAALLKQPRPCALLFVGPPGAGKTAMGLAVAEQLPGTLHHISSQKCDVSGLDRLYELCQYSPARGNWHVALVDEVGDISEKAQLQLLSRLDGTASLKPLFGGGAERGTPPPIIWIFTTNGNGPEHTRPPYSLLPRFVSRCMVLPFEKAPDKLLSGYLARVWRKERGPAGLPKEYFDTLATGVGVRDALMRLDVELLAPPNSRDLTREFAKQRKAIASVHPLPPDDDEIRHFAATKAWATRRGVASVGK